MKTAIRTAVLAAALTLVGAAAHASVQRYYSYDADNDFARHRTQDLVLTVRQGLLGGVRVLHLNRTRGEAFDLKPSVPWSEHALTPILGQYAGSALLYQVDPVEGAGFARGACKGAEQAWLAMFAPKANEPLRIVVLSQGPAKREPVLCEILDYRWRGEYLLPLPRHGPRIEDETKPGRAAAAAR